jgi:hypothetical protein
MPKWTLTPEEDAELWRIWDQIGFQYDEHVKEYRFRRRIGLMVLRPQPLVVPATNC